MKKRQARYGTIVAIMLAVCLPHQAGALESRRDLGRPGSWKTGEARFDWMDAKRDRRVTVTVHYPEGAGNFPVILFSHGLGGSGDGYRYLGRHWASHGYVVVHPDHRDLAGQPVAGGPSPQALQNARNRPLDLRFVLDRLAELNAAPGLFQGRLDLTRVGAAGHSFGASTVLAVAGFRPDAGGGSPAFLDRRISAVIPLSTPAPRKRDDLDRAFAEVTIPSLHITGTRDDSPLGETRAAERRIPFDHLRGAETLLITLVGADHFTFADHGPAAPARALDEVHHQLIKAATVAFWDAYLRGDQAARGWLFDGELRQALGEQGVLEVRRAP